ncbi:biotin--[acetyl-CoA-carboxylase] ligase [Xylanibacillus composti]|uniref:Bifunctional ligase/repressor BirA n=1 Tax=Xylanibacillus composti TaxID=1572762 RepID=A0A8J4GYK5_9BACL|nr:biotin--[acetyl-CoA-carboxylase] ligase [Xylanibacillus composti]MDT9725494.1 biotin--[acetyl-CoA-carboxylase] ligase [Xylanibacillus composti]GIQ67588.1 bifunctional ligase/repressor BirA [Xylanibacillus composti]
MNRLLELFASRPDQYLSGEEISRTLGVSRSAVWKQINRLREEGYVFDAVPRVGYKLAGKPDKLQASSILAKLKTNKLGRPLFLFDQLDSTQNEAQRRLSEGAEEGSLILAEEQTAGKGRLGRSWHSPPGKGLWMSLILKPDIPFASAPHLTLLTAVALCRCIRRLTKIEALIKWPNDLLVAGKKISGILLETRLEEERLVSVAAGIGICVNLEQADFPAELQDKATSLMLAGGEPVDREVLLVAFLEEMEHWYELYLREGFAPIRTVWEALSTSLQRRVAVGGVEGMAVGLNEQGALLVRLDDGRTVPIFSSNIAESTPAG